MIIKMSLYPEPINNLSLAFSERNPLVKNNYSSS